MSPTGGGCSSPWPSSALPCCSRPSSGSIETLPSTRRDPTGVRGAGVAIGVLLRDRRYLGHTLAGALAFGTLMAYISASPFVLEYIHGLSAQEFSLVFAANGIGILIARQLGAGQLAQHAPGGVMRAALAAQATAATLLLAVTVLGLGLIALLVCLFVAASSLGVIQPMATALAMNDHPQRAGSASGLVGFSQFILGAIVAPLVGVAGSGTALPMAIAMPACSLLAMASLRLTRPRPT